MSLSKQSIENLLDLVEIKIGCLQIIDRDDARELKHLEVCRRELIGMQAEVKALRRRGRPAAVVHH
jgi:cell fate regulator YaaT (PSP1 superfamily)